MRVVLEDIHQLHDVLMGAAAGHAANLVVQCVTLGGALTLVDNLHGTGQAGGGLRLAEMDRCKSTPECSVSRNGQAQAKGLPYLPISFWSTQWFENGSFFANSICL